MRFAAIPLLLLGLAACVDRPSNQVPLSKEPISVRGWVADVEGSPTVPLKTAETEAVRKIQLFQSTDVQVDNAPYVSGGVAENGSFVLLDVPPGTVTLTFNAPGAPGARLLLQNIPGSADVLIPSILLKKNGGVAILDPKGVRIRIADKIDKPHPTGKSALVNGVSVPITLVPINDMVDRRDWPNPPGVRPLATVR
jgi:hypothetical protein